MESGPEATVETEVGGAVSTLTLRVSAPDVAGARRLIRSTAHAAGLDRHEIDQFVLAANEIIINAVQHGGGIAEVTISCPEGRVVVEVLDHGPGMAVTAPHTLPPVDRPGGRGLWLAARLCEDVSFDSTPEGTRVRLRTTPAARP